MDPMMTVLMSVLGSGGIIAAALKGYTVWLDKRQGAEIDRQKALDKERVDTAHAFITYMQGQVAEAAKTSAAVVETMGKMTQSLSEITKSLDAVTRTQVEMFNEIRDLKKDHVCKASPAPAAPRKKAS